MRLLIGATVCRRVKLCWLSWQVIKLSRNGAATKSQFPLELHTHSNKHTQRVTHREPDSIGHPPNLKLISHLSLSPKSLLRCGELSALLEWILFGSLFACRSDSFSPCSCYSVVSAWFHCVLSRFCLDIYSEYEIEMSSASCFILKKL